MTNRLLLQIGPSGSIESDGPILKGPDDFTSPYFSFPLTRPGLFPIRCGHTGWGRLSDALSLGRLLSLLRSFCLSFLSKRLLSFWFSFLGAFFLSFNVSLRRSASFLEPFDLLFIRGLFFGLRCAPIFTLLHGGGTIGIKGSSFGCLHHVPAPMVTAMPMTKRAATFLETVFFTCIISMIGTSLCGG